MKLRAQLDFFDDDSDIFGLRCADESLAIQSEKDEADINVIVGRYARLGVAPQNVKVPLNAEFVDIVDFREAMDAVVAAQRSFDAMPADVRRRFGNDAAAFVDFCSEVEADPDTGEVSLVNIDEMRKFGLAIAKPVESSGVSGGVSAESAGGAASGSGTGSGT